MKRLHFLAGTLTAAAVLSYPKRSEAQSPQALRVLLGKGDAAKVDPQTFTFDGRRYRGTFSLLPETNEVVTTVDLEQYLYSVVSREMPRSWPQAALQTQAIVARTYVLQRSDPNRDYDLVPSEADQVYTGIDAESAQSTAAVDATRGSVLRYANGFAHLFYSSCCGGHTESSSNAWGGAPLEYVGGVSCDYCKDSPWFSWSHSIPVDALQKNLAIALSVGAIQSVQLDPPDSSGRPLFWTFTGAQGSARLKAADVRRGAGSRTLPSLRVSQAQVDGDSVSVTGAGLGHGVGLCQWGARGYALQGAQARDILAFYFPGTTVAVV